MKSLSRKKKTEEKSEEKSEKPQSEPKRSISDEAAKNSVVKSDMLERRLPGEKLSDWKKRVGLTKEEPKKPKVIK
jgi:hypothetical protein